MGLDDECGSAGRWQRESISDCEERTAQGGTDREGIVGTFGDIFQKVTEKTMKRVHHAHALRVLPSSQYLDYNRGSGRCRSMKKRGTEMADAADQATILKKHLEILIADRRAIVLGLDEAGDIREKLDRLVAQQNRIDAVKAALADETDRALQKR